MALLREEFMSSWRDHVIDIHDYPKPGIVFKDITPLLANGPAFGAAIKEMAAFCRNSGLHPDVLACPEARGFIFAAALANEMGIGFIPLRKPNKLPRPTARLHFQLEYGEDVLEVHRDDVKPGMKILMVDDVLATGGTMAACVQLLEELGAQVIGAVFLLEIARLGGRGRLPNFPVGALIQQ